MVIDLVLIGLAITLEPVPLTAFILVLSSKGGVRKGAAFIIGWLISLATVVAFTLFVTGNNPPKPNTSPALAVLAVKIAIGVALVVIAARQWRRMGKPKKPKKPPAWQARVDNMSPAFAVVLAPLVQPWGLVAAGVAVITEAKLSSIQSSITLILFCALSVSTYVALELYAALRPSKIQAVLDAVRAWINTHTDQVIIVVSLVVGLWLIAQSIYLIVT
jgi:threonine/homoserine/homoserine lactone efflux protein